MSLNSCHIKNAVFIYRLTSCIPTRTVNTSIVYTLKELVHRYQLFVSIVYDIFATNYDNFHFIICCMYVHPPSHSLCSSLQHKHNSFIVKQCYVTVLHMVCCYNRRSRLRKCHSASESKSVGKTIYEQAYLHTCLSNLRNRHVIADVTAWNSFA